MSDRKRDREDILSESSRHFWERAAHQDSAWYVATGFSSQTSEFFRQGAEEADTFLEFCGVSVASTDTVLEIGCGVGRMTRRLSVLAATVLASDISTEMLRQCAVNLSDRSNVEYMLVPGDGSLPDIERESVQVVFSYITLQHVPSKAAQLLYLSEACRVLAPAGQLAVQIRGVSPVAMILDWMGHVRHIIAGRHTLSRSWRGVRLSDADILNCLASGGLTAARVDKFGVRHRWVVGMKPGQSR